MFKQTVLAIALAGAAFAQSDTGSAPQPASQPPNVAQRPDPAKQLQADLNEMDSLLNNMAAETAFVKDTNLQILLNTNYRLWSILLRDLRLQVEQQKKQEAGQSQPK